MFKLQTVNSGSIGFLYIEIGKIIVQNISNFNPKRFRIAKVQ